MAIHNDLLETERYDLSLVIIKTADARGHSIDTQGP